MSVFKKIVNLQRSHFNLLKTLYFNFKVFDFKTAVKLPVWLYGSIYLEGLHAGCVELRKVKRGVVKIGGGWHTELLGYSNRHKSYLRICGKLVLGERIIILQGILLSVSKNAVLRIGNNVRFNERVIIHSKESITIDDNSGLGWNTQVLDTNFHYLINNGKLDYRNAPVFIGRNVWVANNVSIMKGAYLPDYTVVASNSLVNKSFKEIGDHCLIGGVPAKFLSSGVEWQLMKDLEIDKLFKDGNKVIDYEEYKDELQKEKYHIK